MAKRREELHEKLCELLGSRNCYYQPPSNLEMKYPCIRYELSSIQLDHANNKPYIKHKEYLLIVIDKNPDSEIPDKLLEEFEYCSMNRSSYTADNLHHFPLTLYW